MKQVTWFDVISYLVVSVLAVGMAFLVSLRFVTRSHSQTNPATAPVTGKETPTQESASAVAAEVQGFLEPFIYSAKNRRDPFQTYVDFRPAENLNLSPLQRWDLDELHLVGVMWDVHNPKAMFIDPDKQVHVAGRDESIGKKNGYIAAIREGEVVVVESIRKDGELQFKPRVLRMER